MIRADNVSVEFSRGLLRGGPVTVLEGFSIEVEKGGIHALIGPNGAGKSTAMYAMLGLLRTKHGSITLGGQKPYPGSPIFSWVSYLPEEAHYHLSLTPREGLRYYCDLYGQRFSESRISEALDMVGLDARDDTILSKCSKGMRQKFGLAQCLINKPRLLFLDEPTRGLDPMAVRSFRDALREINVSGATIMINSHVLSEVEMLCSEVTMLKAGRIVRQGSMGDVTELDMTIYKVSFTSFEGPLPAYLSRVEHSNYTVTADLPVDKAPEFYALVRERGSLVLECAIKKTPLEDVFMSLAAPDGQCGRDGQDD